MIRCHDGRRKGPFFGPRMADSPIVVGIRIHNAPMRRPKKVRFWNPRGVDAPLVVGIVIYEAPRRRREMSHFRYPMGRVAASGGDKDT